MASRDQSNPKPTVVHAEPYVPAETSLPELTWKAVVLGVLMAVVLGAAADDLYEMKDLPAAIAAGQALIERYPEADAEKSFFRF